VVTFNHCEQSCSVLDGFTIKHDVGLYGGGIYIACASPTIKNCYVTDNVADANDMGVGGLGGGIYVTGSGASPLILNDLILNNTASADPGGGGICADNGATPIVRNCTIARNEANTHGGGVFVSAGSGMGVEGSIIWDNHLGMSDAPDDVWAAGVLTANCTDIFRSSGSIEGDSNQAADPLFAAGTLGSFYLAAASACADAGRGLPQEELAARTTRPDGTVDRGQVDLGFHYEKHPIWIQEVWTGDANGNRKSSFSPGEPMTYNIRYTIEEPAATTCAAIGTVKRGTATYTRREKHQAGTYIMRISKIAPAAVGTKKTTVTMKLKNATKTTLFATDSVPLSFRVQ
jgi:hypothetical protein